MTPKFITRILLYVALVGPASSTHAALGFESSVGAAERFKSAYLALPTNPENIAAFEGAAHGGNPIAAFYLGLAYQQGRGTAKDEERALMYYKLGANKLRESAFNAARVYWLREKYDEAFPYLVMAADDRSSNGLVQAMVLLGQLYETGKSKTLGTDYMAASRWYELAARQKDSYATAKMGEFSLYGYARAANFRDARAYLERAADMRNPEAQFLMGELFSRGMGAPVNRVDAGKWYLIAEAQAPALKGKRSGFLAGLTELELSSAQKMAVIWNDTHGPAAPIDHLLLLDRLR